MAPTPTLILGTGIVRPRLDGYNLPLERVSLSSPALFVSLGAVPDPREVGRGRVDT